MSLPEMDCWGDVDEARTEADMRVVKRLAVLIIAFVGACFAVGVGALGSWQGWW